MKTVVIRHTNGQQKKVALGKDNTLVAETCGWWGRPYCKTLVLKQNGYYYCADCGLVFKKPVLKETSDVVAIKCDCRQLVNFIELSYDDFFGNDCPTHYYKCKRCERVYKSPHNSRKAPLKFQDSKAAREHIIRRRESVREEQEIRIRGEPKKKFRA